MRKSFVFIALLFCIVLISGQGQAVTLSLDPSSQNIGLGDTAMVDLNIAGLGDLAPDSLGAFALDITYNDSILSFDSVVFGNYLGDPSFFEADSFVDDSISGIVYLDEVSWLWDFELDALQPSGFTLATLSFTGIDLGDSVIGLENVVLSDAFGFQLTDPILEAAGVSVVPEPSTMLLLGGGLLGLVSFRKKLRK